MVMWYIRCVFVEVDVVKVVGYYNGFGMMGEICLGL